jgi:hypothetical protein
VLNHYKYVANIKKKPSSLKKSTHNGTSQAKTPKAILFPAADIGLTFD